MTVEDDIQAPPRLDKIALWAALILYLAVQLLAASRVGFALEYPLDDVYIHLAMASEIAKGGYGVNSGEIASAASSALYPVLLTPFPDSGLQRLLPLLWNVVGLGLTAWLWGKALIWAGYRGTPGVFLAVVFPLFVGAVSTAYVGMEHTLHAAASLAIVFGLLRFLEDGKLTWILFAGLLFAPLFRFEGLALCTMAVAVLLIRGRPFAAVLGAVLSFVPIGFFIYYLLSLGLDPLPNSVQAKLMTNEEVDQSRLTRLFDTYFINMSKIGGMQIVGMTGVLMGLGLLTATRTKAALPLLGALLLAAGLAGQGYISMDVEARIGLVGPVAMLSLGGVVFLGIATLTSLREDETDTNRIWFVLALAAAAMGHAFFAQTGWMERYEHYIVAALALGLVAVAGLAARRRRVAMTLATVAIVAAGANYTYKTAMKYPWGSRAIHLQQYQMAVFAKDFLNRNVAVNDLGWVSWGNPNYVLDLYGLANHEARRLRIFDPQPGWGGPLVKERDVAVIMIYRSFIEDAIAPEWVPLGMLVQNEAKGFLGDDRVHFFAADFSKVPVAEAALREWNKTLLPDSCFVREGETTCWAK